MSISHGTATRTALCDTAVDRIDLGSTFGKLKFLTAVDGVLCTITLAKPAFGSASGASAVMLGTPVSGTVASGGTITKFYVTDSDDTTILQGLVSTSGSDINLSSVVVNVGDVIQLDAITYTSAT